MAAIGAFVNPFFGMAPPQGRGMANQGGFGGQARRRALMRMGGAANAGMGGEMLVGGIASGGGYGGDYGGVQPTAESTGTGTFGMRVPGWNMEGAEQQLAATGKYSPEWIERWRQRVQRPLPTGMFA